MNIPRFNTYQKVILCLGALAVVIRCFDVDRYVNFTEVFFHCVGIAILAGLLVYLTGILTQTKRRLKITAIVLGIIILLSIGLVIIEELTKSTSPTTQVLSPEEWLRQRRAKESQGKTYTLEEYLEEARRRELITEEEFQRRKKEEKVRREKELNKK